MRHAEFAFYIERDSSWARIIVGKIKRTIVKRYCAHKPLCVKGTPYI